MPERCAFSAKGVGTPQINECKYFFPYIGPCKKELPGLGRTFSAGVVRFSCFFQLSLWISCGKYLLFHSSLPTSDRILTPFWSKSSSSSRDLWGGGAESAPRK